MNIKDRLRLMAAADHVAFARDYVCMVAEDETILSTVNPSEVIEALRKVEADIVALWGTYEEAES